MPSWNRNSSQILSTDLFFHHQNGNEFWFESLLPPLTVSPWSGSLKEPHTWKISFWTSRRRKKNRNGSHLIGFCCDIACAMLELGKLVSCHVFLGRHHVICTRCNWKISPRCLHTRNELSCRDDILFLSPIKRKHPSPNCFEKTLAGLRHVLMRFSSRGVPSRILMKLLTRSSPTAFWWESNSEEATWL